MPAVEKAMKKSLIKHFTADELKALADFYGSPVGKSAMKKFGAYMADVMPAIQTEMMKAQAKASPAPEGSPEAGPSRSRRAEAGEPKAGEPKPTASKRPDSESSSQDSEILSGAARG